MYLGKTILKYNGILGCWVICRSCNRGYGFYAVLPNLKQCTDKLVYIPYYVCGEAIAPNFCRSPGVVSADYVIVQDENIKAQFEQHYPDGKPPEGKFLALGSPKFDKVLMSKKDDFILPARWQQIIQGKKIVLYNTSLKAALEHSDMVCRKLRYVF